MGGCCSRSGQRDIAYSTEQYPGNSNTNAASATRRSSTKTSKDKKVKSDMARMMSPAVISPTAKHTASVIFLHGLGDTGHGWCEEFKRNAHPWVKYIFPHAPSQPVTLNGGMTMPSWFDIKGLSANAPQDEDGIIAASNILNQLVEAEAKNVPRERIVVGGFSQGGAVALYHTFMNEQKLGGVLAFSTWLPLHQKLMVSAKEANKRTPVLQCHGDIDPIVPFAWGNMTAQFLKHFNSEHKIITLNGVMHSGSPEEMDETKQFLARVLAEK